MIGITQKEDLNGRYERIDSLEHKYVEYFSFLDEEIVALPNKMKKIPELDGIILSGGGDLYEQPIRNKLEKRLVKYSIDYSIPLLGICRGLQFINYYFGGSLRKVNNHVGKHLVLDFLNIDLATVNSYHNFGIKEEGEGLVTFAISSDGITEGLYHKKYKIAGVQWHPEREGKIKIDRELMKWFKEEMK